MEKKEEKKSFLMYLDYEEHFQYLTDAQLGKLIKIIYEYERTGNVSVIEDGMILMAFSFIKAQLDRDKQKYDKEILKRKIAGKKGSEARWNKNGDILLCNNQEEDSNAINEIAKDSNAIKSIVKNSECKNRIAKMADTDTVTVTDTVTDNVVVDDNKKEIISSYYKEQVKENPPATAISSLLNYKFSEEIIKKAIDIAVLRKKTSFDYINGILKSWYNKGFKNLEDILNETKDSSDFDNLYDN